MVEKKDQQRYRKVKEGDKCARTKEKRRIKERKQVQETRRKLHDQNKRINKYNRVIKETDSGKDSESKNI